MLPAGGNITTRGESHGSHPFNCKWAIFIVPVYIGSMKKWEEKGE